MKRKSIEQVINRYAIINAVNDEWLYEAGTYGQCVSMVHAVVPNGTEYYIVAIMKQATFTEKKEQQ